ncbi:MAG: DNA polymerase, partial [bacterium]
MGEKTAVELIRRFRTLDEVFQHVNLIEKPALRQSLLENKELALTSRKLVTINTQVPLEISLKDLTFGPLNNTFSRRKLLEWEFASILKQIEELEPEIRPHPLEIKGQQLLLGEQENLSGQEIILTADQLRISKRDYHLVNNTEALNEVIRQLQEAQWFALDTETTAIDPMKAELVGISFSCRVGEGWYVPVKHFNGIPESYHPQISTPVRPNTSRETLFILETLKPILEDEKIKKVGQNLKYDLLVFKCYEIEVQGVEFDTMLASYVLDPTSRQHGIDFMAEKFLGISKTPTSQLIGSGPRQGSMADVPIDQICDYACEDADVALRLTLYFRDKIKEADQETLFYQLEMPLIPVLVQMEYNGVKLDTDYLKELSREFQQELDQLEEEIYQVAGTRFNINSTQQLAEILYEKLKLPKGRKTKFGYSTDNEELERLREIAPESKIPDLLLRYRHFSKLKSTYVDALPQTINPLTGRIHTSYSQISAATGRLVSSEPNLQNIPVRSEDGGRIRRAFIPEEKGWVILSADYSQIELRIMAHLSQDDRLITAF